MELYMIMLLYAVVILSLLFFFFFQAEDGIRDLTVTGVQTCALPIYPNSFQAPPVGPPPTPSRSSLRGGGLQDWDMSLFKNIKLGSNEQHSIQLRLEAFNVFNHPNFQNVNLNWTVNPPSGTSPTTLSINTRAAGCTGLVGSCFGEYSNTYSGNGGPRVIQLGAKCYFYVN